MRSFSTYLTENEVNLVVKTSGEQIREFFTFLRYRQMNSLFFKYVQGVDQLLAKDDEMAKIVSRFERHPADFADKKLVAYGSNIKEANKHPVRIEVRRTPKVKGAAQIAVRGVTGEFREVTLHVLKSLPAFVSKHLVVKQGGFKSFEVNVAEVTKALPIIYLQENWEKILKEMHYTAGTHIDARKTKTVIAADGDGTLFGKPTTAGVPGFKKSPVTADLLNYLKLGGIFILISGNSLERTVRRVIEKLPLKYRNRFLISANGGADLVIFDSKGNPKTSDKYRREALKFLHKKATSLLDIVYLGDDAELHGNDGEAFNIVGKSRSILVGTPHIKTKHWFLKSQMMAGNEKASAKFLNAVCQEAIEGPLEHLFSQKRLTRICRQAALKKA